MLTTVTAKIRATLVPVSAIAVAVAATATLGAGPAAAATIHEQLPTTSQGSTSQGSTGMTMHITNDSNEPMALVKADNYYGSWKQQATDIPAHSTIDVSDTSNNVNGAQISLTYQMPDGTEIHLEGMVPLTGKNQVSSYHSTDRYKISAQYDSGYHPTFNYHVYNA